jgi:hypothetical protein
MPRQPRASVDPEPVEGSGQPLTIEQRVDALEASAGVLLSAAWRRLVAAVLQHLDDTRPKRSED